MPKTIHYCNGQVPPKNTVPSIKIISNIPVNTGSPQYEKMKYWLTKRERERERGKWKENDEDEGERRKKNQKNPADWISPQLHENVSLWVSTIQILLFPCTSARWSLQTRAGRRESMLLITCRSELGVHGFDSVRLAAAAASTTRFIIYYWTDTAAVIWIVFKILRWKWFWA